MSFLFKVLIEWVLLDVESYIGAAYRSVFKPDFFKKENIYFDIKVNSVNKYKSLSI